MGTDQFSRVMSRFTELSLKMQKSMAEAMGQYFSALNLPAPQRVGASSACAH